MYLNDFILRKALFVSILRQDMAFFDKNTPGELNSIIIRYIQSSIKSSKTIIIFV